MQLFYIIHGTSYEIFFIYFLVIEENAKGTPAKITHKTISFIYFNAFIFKFKIKAMIIKYNINIKKGIIICYFKTFIKLLLIALFVNTNIAIIEDQINIAISLVVKISNTFLFPPYHKN